MVSVKYFKDTVLSTGQVIIPSAEQRGITRRGVVITNYGTVNLWITRTQTAAWAVNYGVLVQPNGVYYDELGNDGQMYQGTYWAIADTSPGAFAAEEEFYA